MEFEGISGRDGPPSGKELKPCGPDSRQVLVRERRRALSFAGKVRSGGRIEVLGAPLHSAGSFLIEEADREL